MFITNHVLRLKRHDILFWVSYGIYLSFSILSTSFYYKYFMGAPYVTIKLVCLILLAIRELSGRKYDFRSFFIGVLFASLAMVTVSQSSVSEMAFILIYTFCARDINFKSIAWFSAVISLASIIFVFVGCNVGIIEDYIYTSSTRTRHFLGFRYALYGPVFLFNITGLILYIDGFKINFRKAVGLILINCWIFVMTNSRLSFYLSAIMIVVFVFLKFFPHFFAHMHLICWVMIFSFVFCFVISLYFTVTFDSSVEWKSQLNAFLGGRLRLGQASLIQSGVSLFGQPMELVGNGLDAFGNRNVNTYNYVDSYYIQVLQRYGIVFSAFWIGILTYAMYLYYKIKDYPMMICLTFVALHCVIDDLSLPLFSNTFWFALTIVFTYHQAIYNSPRHVTTRIDLQKCQSKNH